MATSTLTQLLNYAIWAIYVDALLNNSFSLRTSPNREDDHLHDMNPFVHCAGTPTERGWLMLMRWCQRFWTRLTSQWPWVLPQCSVHLLEFVLVCQQMYWLIVLLCQQLNWFIVLLCQQMNWPVLLCQQMDRFIVLLCQQMDWLIVLLCQQMDWIIVLLCQQTDWLIVLMCQQMDWLIVLLCQEMDWLIVLLWQQMDWLMSYCAVMVC